LYFPVNYLDIKSEIPHENSSENFIFTGIVFFYPYLKGW